jgi:predicted alpha-1,6-mannanase (GH76 family)
MTMRCLLLAALLVACSADSADDEATSTQSVTGDKRDPAIAAVDRVAGESTVWGRRIVLHISDSESAAWGSIENGEPNDEVWLDRSYDGGLGWDGRVGKTKIPENGRSWRTLMFSIDDPANHGIGAVRACGKAGNRSEITCTSWQRPTSSSRLDAAATALMMLYDRGNGKWKTAGWWNSANAMTALLDYMQRTGSTTHRWAIANTFDKNKGDHYENDYMDDTAWWGLAWIRAYDVTGEQRYLDMARGTADYLWSFKDGHCGGGVWWRNDKRYKNAVTNELFIKLSASVHNRTPGDTVYRDRAEEVWSWFKGTGMINGQHLINDGLDYDTCKNNGEPTWTYNQGIILGGLVELHKATGKAALLDEARALANASTTDAGLNPGGTLRERCEDEADACGRDAPSFKGAFARGLGELDEYLPDHPYRAYLDAQADALYTKSRTTLDQYGLRWGRPFDVVDASRQHSALDALTAAR